VTTFATTRALSKVAGKDKITVDGIDVTNFRNKRTPLPRYSLAEPFAYGATALEFPQIYAAHEADTFGTGELSWVREGARVVISRTFDTDPEQIDYVGVVLTVVPDGRVLRLEVGGELSGRASCQDVQPPVVRTSQDVGHWAALVAQTLNMTLSPWFGPTTGIKIAQTGGQSLLSWAQYVGTMSQDDDGTQRAMMPATWGSRTWTFNAKNTTTKHLTLLGPDDARGVLRVTRDATQQPNVWYGTGISPDGIRWRNAKWPGVFQGTPDEYPIAGGGSFGVGTTNADTIDNDGITTLWVNLQQRGYLPPASAGSSTVYGSEMAKAVKALQRDADLAVTGTMTSAAWDALFDLSVTGFDVNGAKVFPLVEDPRVRKFTYSATGAVIGRNPAYDPTVLRVERTIDFGPGVDKATGRAWCVGQMARASGKNWVGTIELNATGAFWGAHNDESTVTAADVASFRDIRPGMNIWVPYFDGGTLFHISGVDVGPDGATLTVDTQARDLMELREIIDRNQAGKRDTRRAWLLQNQPTKASGNMVTADEDFGILFNKVHLDGGKWNVFPVIAGQHGQVGKVDLRMVDGAEYAVAAFSKKITRRRLHRKVGDPLTTADESVWETSDIQDWYDDGLLLYAVGDGKQPCGYGRRRKLNDNGDPTGAPLTGRFIDFATWPYYHAPETAVLIYMAIYPDRDCTLKRGQILWAQLDDAV
jgi:peptidoglycan hydrolase-like protein with peptidoglycan-binding domain